MAAAVAFPDGAQVAVAPGVVRSSAHLRTAAEGDDRDPGAVVGLAAGATLDDVRAFLAGERPAGTGARIVRDFFVDAGDAAALSPGHLVRTVGLGPTEVLWAGADGATFCFRGRSDVTRLDPDTMAVVDTYPTHPSDLWPRAAFFLPRSGAEDRELLPVRPEGTYQVRALRSGALSQVRLRIHGQPAVHQSFHPEGLAVFRATDPSPAPAGPEAAAADEEHGLWEEGSAGDEEEEEEEEEEEGVWRYYAVPLAALAALLDAAPVGGPGGVELAGVAWEFTSSEVRAWHVVEPGVPLLSPMDGSRLRIAGRWDVPVKHRWAGLVHGWRDAACAISEAGDVVVVTPEGELRTVATGVAPGAAWDVLRSAALVTGGRLSVLVARMDRLLWRATVVGPVPLRVVAEPNHARAGVAEAAEALAALGDPDLVPLLGPTGQALTEAAGPAVPRLAGAAEQEHQPNPHRYAVQRREAEAGAHGLERAHQQLAWGRFRPY